MALSFHIFKFCKYFRKIYILCILVTRHDRPFCDDKVLTAVNVNITFSWAMAPCDLVDGNQSFAGAFGKAGFKGTKQNSQILLRHLLL
jgi:hypothetical protein